MDDLQDFREYSIGCYLMFHSNSMFYIIFLFQKGVVDGTILISSFISHKSGLLLRIPFFLDLGQLFPLLPLFSCISLFQSDCLLIHFIWKMTNLELVSEIFLKLLKNFHSIPNHCFEWDTSLNWGRMPVCRKNLIWFHDYRFQKRRFTKVLVYSQVRSCSGSPISENP